MSWDVARYLHWFMFIHLWKDEVLAFIGGECNGRVGSAQLVQNECCEIPSSSFSVPLEMPGAFRPYFDGLLEQKVVLLSVSICINCQVACGL